MPSPRSDPSEHAAIRHEVACELHDGILQFLTGASFQIEAILRLSAEDPAAALRSLRSVGDAMAHEQRELRLYIGEIRDETDGCGGAADGRGAFPCRLDETLRRVGDLWGVEVSLDMEPEAAIQEPGRTALRVVQEAVVNAVRHGRATRVDVSVRSAPGAVALIIADNGKGFSFTGSLELAQLSRDRLGPVSLKRRVEAAGGGLRIDSGPDGATVRVTLPLANGSGS